MKKHVDSQCPRSDCGSPPCLTRYGTTRVKVRKVKRCGEDLSVSTPHDVKPLPLTPLPLVASGVRNISRPPSAAVRVHARMSSSQSIAHPKVCGKFASTRR